MCQSGTRTPGIPYILSETPKNQDIEVYILLEPQNFRTISIIHEVCSTAWLPLKCISKLKQYLLQYQVQRGIVQIITHQNHWLAHCIKWEAPQSYGLAKSIKVKSYRLRKHENNSRHGIPRMSKYDKTIRTSTHVSKCESMQ